MCLHMCHSACVHERAHTHAACARVRVCVRAWTDVWMMRGVVVGFANLVLELTRLVSHA